MIHSAFYGTARRDAEIKASKSGSKYATALLAVPNGADDEGHDQFLFVKVVAFQEFTDELGKLKHKDRCYAEGALDVKVWNSEKGPRPDLTLKAHYVRRTAIGKDRPKTAKRFSRGEPAEHIPASID